MGTVTNIPQAIANAAALVGIDPNIALEVATVESSLNPNAIGAAGEVGLFQLMPSSFPGVNIQDEQTNITTGVNYLASLFTKYGDYGTALAAYNWGPDNVDKAINAYGEEWLSHAPGSVQNYVAEILGNAQTQYTAQVVLPNVSIPSITANVTPIFPIDASEESAPADESEPILIGALVLGVIILFGAIL